MASVSPGLTSALLQRLPGFEDSSEPQRRLYRENPELWLRERLGEHLWSKQSEIFASVKANRRTAVKSCHGSGKSHVASRIVAWWIDTHPPGEAFVVTSAPTFQQVRAILWRYIGQVHRKGHLIGRVNQTEWLLGSELVAFGRKPADHDEAAFQGIHAKYVLVVLDEACGIPEQLWVAADALTTNADTCRILAIGNPDNPMAYFAKACNTGWNTITVSALDSPAFTGESVPDSLLRVLIQPSWVEEKLHEWGEDNPLYQSKVLGQFPSDSPDGVIRLSDLLACRVEPAVPITPDELVPVELGVDVGGGGDQTVIRERRGRCAAREWRNSFSSPQAVADSVVTAAVQCGAERIKIDAGGIGWAVTDLVRNGLRLARSPASVVPVNFGSGASDPVKFLNLRAELYWAVGREAAEQRSWDLSVMDNADTTIAQLVEARWDLDPRSRIRVEPKEEIIRRLGRSPDNADALLLAFYSPRGQGAMFVEAWKQMRGAADAGHERRRHPYVGGERCPLCENTQESPP